MNWKLIVGLSLFGLAMAFATVFLIPSRIEPAFWLGIFTLCAVAIARWAPGRYFLHGLCVSLVNCVWITSVHVLFFDTYVAGHADEASMLVSSPLPPRLLMALVGTAIGVLSGVVLGLFSWIASKVVSAAPGARAAGTLPAQPSP